MSVSVTHFQSDCTKFICRLCCSEYSLIVVIIKESYVSGSAREAGAAAAVVTTRKEEKYAELDSRYFFEPIAVETLVFNTSLLKEIGLKISLNTGESRETSFLYQRISVLVQRFNAVLLHDSLPTVDCTD